jgi:2-dehydropantoate 2-reductase
MRIAVMGAGAVGCFYGGMLARAGHAVTLIGRAEHVRAMQRDGLRLDAQSFQANLPVRADTEPSAVAGAKLVLFCVKSTDTLAAADALKPHLGADTVLLSLQNGVDNADRLRTAVAQEVIASVVYVATEMAGPGHVRHNGRGELVIGTSGSSAEIAALFTEAGVPMKVSDNVAGELWSKLIVNCAYNALSAISRMQYGRMVQVEGVTAVMDDVVVECLEVARAAGVTVPGDLRKSVPALALGMPAQYSSTAQDLMRGKPSEIDHLNGYVVQRGLALGVQTPVNRVLHTVVKMLETKAA